MVKRSNRISNISSREALGLSAKDFKGLSRAEMAKAVSSIASAANKRISRLEKAGQPITDTVKKFSVAGKNRNELMREFRRVKDFMQAETLSLRGQKVVADKVARGLAGEFTGEGSGKKYEEKLAEIKSVLGGKEASRERDTFWRAYERLKESNPIVANKQYKYKILGEQIKVMKERPGISVEELHARMKQDADSIYEAEQEQEAVKDVFTFISK